MGADALRHHLGQRVEILEIAGDEPDEGLAVKFYASEAMISLSYNAEMPPAPHLRLLQIPASGYDLVDLDAVPAGAAIANVYEHEVGIAEYVFAGMLEWTIGLGGRDARFRAGDWTGNPRMDGATRPELAGKSIGLVGYGHIGQAVAGRAKAFDMRVLALTRNPRALQPEPDFLGTYAELDRVIPDCDFLVVCCPLAPETEGMIDDGRIALMKSDAVLFNVARGPIVDQSALHAALAARRIGGAVLDAWYNYATPAAPNVAPADHPFHELDNVIMTPHISGWTTAQQERRWAKMIENMSRLIDGRPLLNVIRPAGGTETSDAEPA